MSSRPLAAACRVALALSALLLLLSAPASPTTMVMMSDEALSIGSDAIVAGTVTDIQTVRAQSGAIHTYVTLSAEEVLKGYLPGGKAIIREQGGRIGKHERWIFGNPTYALGDSVIVFLVQDTEGFLRTNQMALGKFAVESDAETGGSVAVRSLDDVLLLGVTRLQSRAPDDRRPAAAFKARLRTIVRSQPVPAFRRPFAAAPLELEREGSVTASVGDFRLFNNVRWFEPDSGQPVDYLIDRAGDAKIGPGGSENAVNAALAAWTNVSTSALVVQSAGLTTATPSSGCDGQSMIVFNDPFNLITDPSGCGGILAIGGYCASGNTTVVNDTTFRQIVEGDITFNNGWSNCSFWNQTNLAEVSAHEIGHTIGLAHSTDSAATMYAFAHFDRRGASVMADDAAGATFIYPASATSPTTPTPAAPDEDGDGVPDDLDNCPQTPNPTQADGDGDASGDACDNCIALPNPDQSPEDACGLLILRKMSISLGRNGPASDDKFRMNGTFVAAAASSLSDLAGQPLGISVSDPEGYVMVQVAVPAGYWTSNLSGTKLVFRDSTGTLLGGLTRVVLRSRNGIDYAFAATAKNLDLAAGGAPDLAVALESDGQTYVGASPCKTNRRATRVICRQER